MSQHLSHEQLSEYVDEQLSLEERRYVESHVVSCSFCALELARLRELISALRLLPAHSQATAQLRPLARRAVRHRPHAVPAMLAAALAAVALGTLLITGRSPRQANEDNEAAVAALRVVDSAINELQQAAAQQPRDGLIRELLEHARRRRAQVVADAQLSEER